MCCMVALSTNATIIIYVAQEHEVFREFAHCTHSFANIEACQWFVCVCVCMRAIFFSSLSGHKSSKKQNSPRTDVSLECK